MLHGAQSLRDVAQDDGEESSPWQLEPRDGGLGGELRAVPLEAIDRTPFPHAARHIGAAAEVDHMMRMCVAVARREQSRERLADDVALGVSEELLRPVIEVQDALLLVDRDDRVDRDGEDPLELGARGTEFSLHLQPPLELTRQQPRTEERDRGGDEGQDEGDAPHPPACPLAGQRRLREQQPARDHQYGQGEEQDDPVGGEPRTIHDASRGRFRRSGRSRTSWDCAACRR